MLAHCFEHFYNSILRWDAIVCWVGAHSSEIRMFFYHLAKSICSNVNVAIVSPWCWKKRKILLLFTFNFIWDASVSASKVMLYLHEHNWGQNLSQELHYARCQAHAAPSRWELQELGTSLDFSQIHCKVTYSKEQRSFFHNKHKNNICEWISKHLSVQWAGSCLWYFSSDGRVAALEGYAWGSGFFIFYAMQRNISAQFLPFLCQPLWFEETPQCQNLLLFPGLVLCRDARLNIRCLNISNLIDDNDVLTATVGSGSAPPSCFPRLQSH